MRELVTKRYLKIFKDEMERSSLILEKIREITEDETANCESFHLAIYIGYEDRFVRDFR